MLPLLPGVSSQIMNCTPGATGVGPAPGTIAPCWLHPTASSQLIRGCSGSAERTKASHKQRKRPSNKGTALEGGGCGWGTVGFATGNRPADGVPAGCMIPETRSRGTPEPCAGWRLPRSLLSPRTQGTGSPGSRPTGRLQRTPRRPACWWGWWERAGHCGHPPPDKHSDRPCTEAWHSQEKPEGHRSQDAAKWRRHGHAAPAREDPEDGASGRLQNETALPLRGHTIKGAGNPQATLPWEDVGPPGPHVAHAGGTCTGGSGYIRVQGQHDCGRGGHVAGSPSASGGAGGRVPGPSRSTLVAGRARGSWEPQGSWEEGGGEHSAGHMRGREGDLRLATEGGEASTRQRDHPDQGSGAGREGPEGSGRPAGGGDPIAAQPRTPAPPPRSYNLCPRPRREAQMGQTRTGPAPWGRPAHPAHSPSLPTSTPQASLPGPRASASRTSKPTHRATGAPSPCLHPLGGPRTRLPHPARPSPPTKGRCPHQLLPDEDVTLSLPSFLCWGPTLRPRKLETGQVRKCTPGTEGRRAGGVGEGGVEVGRKARVHQPPPCLWGPAPTSPQSGWEATLKPRGPGHLPGVVTRGPGRQPQGAPPAQGHPPCQVQGCRTQGHAQRHPR